jgi:DNA polymerase
VNGIREPRTGLWRARLAHAADFEGWRDQARRLVAAGIPSRMVAWQVGEGTPGLFGAERETASLATVPPARAPRVPARFPALAALVVCHKAADRFTLLHRLLERLQGEPQLLAVATDPDVVRAETMGKNVRRCSHKMKAFVRFRSTHDADGVERFVAWFEPEHHTLDMTAPFFVRRFAGQRWSILTPDRSAHWDGEALTLGGGAAKDIAPDGDVNEDLWRTYFGAIFNPARLKVKAMTSEMPKRYWKNMPEAELIDPLIRQAADRTVGMIAAPASPPARSTRIAREREAEARAMTELAGNVTSLADLAAAARHCERCPLYRDATQVVVGEGPAGAPLMLVGEQPGDQEDIAGRPFVGPAGQLLDRALADAGIARSAAFVTNAVKHFKFEPRGKRRIHARPSNSEIEACRWWLDAELKIVKPRLVVAMGATAARALSGRALTISRERGRLLAWPGGTAGFVTVHPSYLLRLPDPEAKRTEYAHFVADLALARETLTTISPPM